MAKLFKTKEAAIAAADKNNPYGYYGADACKKYTCMECGAVMYGYSGSKYSTMPECACGVSDMWKGEAVC